MAVSLVKKFIKNQQQSRRTSSRCIVNKPPVFAPRICLFRIFGASLTRLDLFPPFCNMPATLPLLQPAIPLLDPGSPGPARPFLQSRLPERCPQHVPVRGIALPRARDFALPFFELLEVPVSPLLYPVDVPLAGWQHNSLGAPAPPPSSVSPAGVLSLHAACPGIQNFTERVEQDWTSS